MESDLMTRVRVSEQRFWKAVDRKDPFACWEWKLYRDKRGYGSFTFGVIKQKAHRVAFALSNGYLPPVVRHACDNPPCCNPRHLEAGSQQENMIDMAQRGRSTRGTYRGKVILSASDIDLIRNSREPNTHLAKRLGVHHSTISAIRLGKSWKHYESSTK